MFTWKFIFFFSLFILFTDASILVSFSLPRNWYRLTGESSPASDLSRDLRSINAIRVMCMGGVILGHSALSTSITPVYNPQFLESVNYLLSLSMILLKFFNAMLYLILFLFRNTTVYHR